MLTVNVFYPESIFTSQINYSTRPNKIGLTQNWETYKTGNLAWDFVVQKIQEIVGFGNLGGSPYTTSKTWTAMQKGNHIKVIPKCSIQFKLKHRKYTVNDIKFSILTRCNTHRTYRKLYLPVKTEPRIVHKYFLRRHFDWHNDSYNPLCHIYTYAQIYILCWLHKKNKLIL